MMKIIKLNGKMFA